MKQRSKQYTDGEFRMQLINSRTDVKSQRLHNFYQIYMAVSEHFHVNFIEYVALKFH